MIHLERIISFEVQYHQTKNWYRNQMVANQRAVKYFERNKLLTKTVYYSTKVLDHFTSIFLNDLNYYCI